MPGMFLLRIAMMIISAPIRVVPARVSFPLHPHACSRNTGEAIQNQHHDRRIEECKWMNR